MVDRSWERRAMAITDYDHQAVIWCGEKADLPHFLDQAGALNKKAKGKAADAQHKLTLDSQAMFPGMQEADDKALAEMLEALTDKSRLYICGHGSLGAAPKFVCWDAKTFAGLLKSHGLKRAKLINLVSCQLARDYRPNLQGHVFPLADSFAARFHQELKDQEPALLTEVRAYTWFVAVNLGFIGDLPTASKVMVEKATDSVVDGWVYKPPGYKISFYWEGSTQRRRYMNESGNSLIEFPLVVR